MSWKKYSLSDCCLSISDGDHQAPPKSETGIPFVTIANISGTNQFDFSNSMHVPKSYYEALDEKRKPRKGDVLYSVVGSFGIPVLIKRDNPFAFQRHIAILRPNNDILDSRFMYYSMLSRDFFAKADAVAIGAAQRTISLTALRGMEIFAPKLHIQKKIADILSAYDDLIENNQKQIKLLEEAAQRLYKEWFIDLRFPGHETTKIQNDLPAGWTKVLISEVCDTIGGGTPSTKVSDYYDNGNIPWVTPTDITRNNGWILLDTEKKITQKGLENSSAKILPAETILMTSRASIGYFGMYDFPVSTNQGFISCVPYKKEFKYYLLFNLMNRVDEIKQKATGSTFLEIGKTTFRNFEIIYPTKGLLVEFDRMIDPIIKRMRIIKKEIADLAQARDRLLPKLMSGEIEV